MALNITLRSIKGSPLTASEVDSNFSNIKDNLSQALSQSGVISVNGRQGNVVLTASDVTNALGYIPDSGGVTSFNGRTGAIVLSSNDVTSALGFTPTSGNGYAPINSPIFTGSPEADTPIPGTNNDRLATTAFVAAAIAAATSGQNGANGYVILPGGLIMQWGESEVVTAAANQTTTITFPIPFPNAVYQVIVGSVDMTPGSIYTQRVCKLRGPATLTGATIDADSWESLSGTSDDIKAVYFAIGR